MAMPNLRAAAMTHFSAQASEEEPMHHNAELARPRTSERDQSSAWILTPRRNTTASSPCRSHLSSGEPRKGFGWIAFDLTHYSDSDLGARPTEDLPRDMENPPAARSSFAGLPVGGLVGHFRRAGSPATATQNR